MNRLCSAYVGLATPIAPLAPERFGAFQRIEWVYCRRRTLEGGSIGEDEGNRLAGLHRALVFSVKCDRCSQNQTFRSSDGANRAILEPVHPWQSSPVVEPDANLVWKSTHPERPITICTRSAPSAGGMKSIIAAWPVQSGIRFREQACRRDNVDLPREATASEQ